MKCSLFKRFACLSSSAVQSQELPVWFCATPCPLSFCWNRERSLPAALSQWECQWPWELRGSWDTEIRVTALARAVRGVILPAGPASSTVGGKIEPRDSGSLLSVDSHCCLLQGVGKTFYTDTWLNCQCRVTRGVGGSSLFVPSGQRGPRRLPQSLGRCRIAALRWPRAGTVTVPRRLNIATEPWQWVQKSIFVTFSTSEKTTNFCLPLGMAFL